MPTTRARYGTAHRILTLVIAGWMTAVIVAGFVLSVPRLDILEQSARNLYFHVPMWFALMAGMLVSAVYSARYLASPRVEYDVRAEQAALVAMLFGVLGLVTGMVWARFTWYVGTGKWWNFDPKQSFVAVQLLVFSAYFVLRSSLDEERTRGRIAAVYNLFAVAIAPFLLYVLPRQLESLHPGGEGSPAFSQTDLAPEMRMIFYPAVAGFIALFWWLYTQRVRLRLAERRLGERRLGEG